MGSGRVGGLRFWSRIRVRVRVRVRAAPSNAPKAEVLLVAVVRAEAR